MIFYSSVIFSKGGHNPIIPNIIFSTLHFIFTLIAGFSVDKWGRKIMYIFGSAGIAISLIATGSLYKVNAYIPAITFIQFFIIWFALSHGPICWIYTSEISQPKGLSISVAFNFLFILLVGLFTLPLLKILQGVFFDILGGLMIIV